MHIEQPQRRRRLVSLTPLIDVIFILLIFFMLASTFVDQHIFSVDAPASSTVAAEDEPDAREPVLIKVTQHGYRLDGKSLGKAGVIAKLREIAGDEQEPIVRVMPTAQAPVRAVIHLLDWSAGEGIEDVAVIRGD